MRRSTILTVTTMTALLATAALAQAGPPTTAARKQAASDPAPRIARLTLTERSEIPAGKLVVPNRAPRLATNGKLGSATCDGLTISIGASGSLVFEDGFEGGNVDPWNPANNTFFSVRSALDLEFTASLQGLSGEALLRLDLTSPRAHHFQTLEAPIVVVASDLETTPQARSVSGYPHPVPVRFAAPQSGGGLAASMIWPLAGTHVVSHGLYGEWTASASLVDPSSPTGESSAVCPAAHFTIQP